MKGFGLIETIVALGLFSVIATAGITGFIPALQMGRSGREQTQATSLLRESQEAVRSIRDRDFGNITAGTFGIGISSSQWSFSGTSDVNDKFTRQINVSQASRDAGGSLVTSGGTTDPDTFTVTSRVTWNNSIGDTRQLSSSNFLTNWRKAIGGISFNGLIVYGAGTSTVPFYRTYSVSSNTFGVETSLPALTGSPRNTVIRTSPTATEAIVGTLSTNGSLYVYCFNGTTWTQDWSVAIGVGTTRTRPFDIAYEKTSGDVLVVYSTNTATTNELNYRTKSGSSACGAANWSGATAFNPVRTSGLVSWVSMAQNPTSGSNLIGVLWADWNKDLSAAIWSGSALSNEMTSVGETKLEAINTGTTFPDSQSFDLAYESVTGDLMTIWGISTGTNGKNGVRYRLCTGNSATCTWGAITTPPTFVDDATNIDLSANPNTDEMRFASIGNAGADLQTGYWSGVGWTNTANLDTTTATPLAGTKLVATGWLTSGATTRSIIVYNDRATTNIGWYVCTLATCTVQTDVGVTPVFANPQKWYEIASNPISKDQMMLVLSDNGSDLFAKRLTMTSTPAFTWTASDGSTQVEISLGGNIVKPFGFAWMNQ